MKDTKLIAILAFVLGAILLLTHPKQVDKIPYVSVRGGGVTIDIGDCHYKSEGVNNYGYEQR